MYILRIPEDYPETWIGEYQKAISPDRFSFRSAVVLASDLGVPRFRFSPSRALLSQYDVLPNDTMVPLLSARIAGLLATLCPVDCQLFPAIVKTSDGELEGYSLLNVITKVAAMDHAQCRFTYIPGTKQIMKVNRLRCKPSAMGPHHLAREADYMSYILASDELKMRFELEKVKGCEFMAPESVHP